MDQGEHWTKIQGSIQDSYISAIQVDPSQPSHAVYGDEWIVSQKK